MAKKQEPFETSQLLNELKTKIDLVEQLVKEDAPFSKVKAASDEVKDFTAKVKTELLARSRENGAPMRYTDDTQSIWVKMSDVEEVDGDSFLYQYGLETVTDRNGNIHQCLRPGLNLAIKFTKKGLIDSGFTKRVDIDWTHCTKVADRRTMLQGVDAVVKECTETIEHVVQCHGIELPKHDKEDATSLVVALHQFGENNLWKA